MLTETLCRIPKSDGLQLLQRRGEHGARELTSWRLSLSPGGTETFAAPGEETVVVLQEGQGVFAAGGGRWTVARRSVFDDRATALYLPPGVSLTVQAGAAQSENKTKPTIESISPAKVTKSNTPQTLTVRGTRFEPGMVVLLTDPTGTVKTISGNAIADISPTSFQFTAILELPGEYSVEVKLPSGALSNTAVVVAE